MELPVLPKDVRIVDTVLNKVMAQCPEYLSPTAFINQLIDQSLTRGVEYAPTVSVRDTPTETDTVQTVQSQEETTHEVVSSLEKIEPVSPPNRLGDGIGMGSGEGKRKGGNWKKEVPLSLECHSELIFAFWNTKAGAKSKQAWALLMTELNKIQEKYDDRALRDQLELAAASRWKSVTLKNYEQFGLKASKPKLDRDPDFDWDSLDGVSFFKQ